jgi:hypothetical protein
LPLLLTVGTGAGVERLVLPDIRHVSNPAIKFVKNPVNLFFAMIKLCKSGMNCIVDLKRLVPYFFLKEFFSRNVL